MPPQSPLPSTLKQIIDEGRAAARNAQKQVVERVRKAVEASSSLATTEQRVQSVGPEPPVVARLVVEIRSDGSRTIARGAMEDVATRERVAIQAEGNSPAQLATALAKSIFTMPLIAAQAVRAIQRGRAPRDVNDEADDER